MITNYTIIGIDSTQNNPGTSLEEQIVTLTTENPTIFEHTIPLNTSQSGNPPSYDPSYQESIDTGEDAGGHVDALPEYSKSREDREIIADRIIPSPPQYLQPKHYVEEDETEDEFLKRAKK